MDHDEFIKTHGKGKMNGYLILKTTFYQLLYVMLGIQKQWKN